MNEDTLIAFGGAIKALSIDGMKATIGGHLVTFTDANNTDLSGEYFNAATYYGAHKGNGMDVMIHHGLPLAAGLEKFGKSLMGPNGLKMVVTEDELGLFASVVLDLSDKYQSLVYDLATKGALKWSSGSAIHMAEIDAETGYIKCWPIIEGSLTPMPVGQQLTNKVLPLKSLMIMTPAIKSVYFSKYLEGDMTTAALRPLYDEMWYKMYDAISSIEKQNATVVDAQAVLAPILDEFKQIYIATFAALMSGKEQPAPTDAIAVKSFLTEFPDVESFLSTTKAGKMISTSNLNELKGIHADHIATGKSVTTNTKRLKALIDKAEAGTLSGDEAAEAEAIVETKSLIDLIEAVKGIDTRLAAIEAPPTADGGIVIPTDPLPTTGNGGVKSMTEEELRAFAADIT